MIALYPREDYANEMAVPKGFPPQKLRVPLVWLGPNDNGAQHLSIMVERIADIYTVIDAQVTGDANLGLPDRGYDDADEVPPWSTQPYETAAYLVTDSQQLESLYYDVLRLASAEVNILPQRVPWIPHIVVGHNMDAQQLMFSGQVLFDRIGLDVNGQTQFFPLVGSGLSVPHDE